MIKEMNYEIAVCDLCGDEKEINFVKKMNLE